MNYLAGGQGAKDYGNPKNLILGGHLLLSYYYNDLQQDS